MALREVFAYLGFEFDDAKLRAANSAVDRLGSGVQAIVSVFAGSALVGGITRFAEQLDVFDDLSAQTKIATEDLQLYGYAAKVSGSSQEEMNAALSLFQKSLGKTTEGTGAQVEALKSLGIQTKDSAGNTRTLAEVLPEVFTNFQGLKSEAEKAEVATALFGRAGVKLIPTLDKGAAGLAAMREEFENFGGPVADETIKAAGEFRDNIVRLDTAWFKLKGQLASSALPTLSNMVELVAHGVAGLSEFAKQTTLADSALYALAGTIAVTLGGALAPYLASGLKFAAIYLAFDDLIAFLKGKDSLIGRALDAAFGEGSAKIVRDGLNAWIAEFEKFRTSADATLDALADKNASTVATMTAAFIALARDAANGFPAMGAAWDAQLASMQALFTGFTLRVMQDWNALVDSLHLPDAFKIDTSGTLDKLAGHENDRQAALERGAAALLEGADSSRVAGSGRTREGKTVDKFDAASSAPALLLRGANQLGPLRADAAAAAPAFQMPGGSPAMQAKDPATGAITYVTVDARTTVQVTEARDGKAAAREVERSQKDAYRRAEQALNRR
jgi:hypothetical protein